MPISAKVEEPTRELIGHVIHGGQDEFEGKLEGLDKTTLEQAVALAMSISGAVAAHVSEANPPSDVALRTLASTVQKVEKEYSLDADEVYRYLSQCIFGSATLSGVFPAHDAVRLPFMIAGNLLASYTKHEQGQAWTDYLDQIEAALQASDPAD